jgi:fucose 4-O-acetylase-like acetyltransferase
MLIKNDSSRNQLIDLLRGIAIMFVVFGHTMVGTTVNSTNSILFNIIWTLQMPLFFLISGYVTKYSSQIINFKDLLLFIKRKTVAYILPWLSWTLLIRGIVFSQSNFLDFRYILWNMDAGYWFLFSIWDNNFVLWYFQFYF